MSQIIIKSYVVFSVSTTSVGGVQEIIAGTNVTVDNTDPSRPIVSSVGGGVEFLIYETVDMSSISNYTMVQDDNNKGKLLGKATAQSVTLPQLITGTQAIFRRTGNGQLSFIAGSGVTITSTKGDLTDPGQNLAVFVSYKSATEVYIDNGVSSGSGIGDVVGPASATDSNFALFDSTTGKLIKDAGFNSNAFQAANDDLSDIASLTPSDGDFIYRESGSWVVKTTSEVQTIIGAGSGVPTSRTLNGMDLTQDRVFPGPYIYKASGRYYSLLDGDTSGGVVQVAGSLKAWPIYVRRSFTFSAMISEITNLQSGAAYRLGIYNDDGTGFYPGTLISGTDTGDLDATANGVKTSTFGANVTLTGGNLYWLAMNHSHTASIRCWAAARASQHFGINNGAALVPFVCLGVSLAFGAMPSTFTAGANPVSTATTSSAPPVVGALIV